VIAFLLWQGLPTGAGAPSITVVLVVLGAIAGLVVNTVAVLHVAWRGGQILGRIDTHVERVVKELERLRASSDEHAQAIARAIQQLDDMNHRVTRLEQ
jgi:endonuclease III